MLKLINKTNEQFESASCRTPQYLSWHRLFKREFKQFLNKLGIEIIQISKPNHFDASGFFQLPSGQIYYFSISDLRWSKDAMLVRTATSFKDYTGGHNQYASLKSAEQFESNFKAIIRL